MNTESSTRLRPSLALKDAKKPTELAEVLKIALQRMREAGLKLTPARKGILRVLLAEHGPFTIEEVHSRLETECDVVTVYRSLRSLETVGIIRRCEFGDGVSRFEFEHPETHHHHIVCRLCNRVEYLALCPLDFLDRYVTEMGYAQVDHRVSFHGVCKHCQHTEKSADDSLV